MRALGWLDGHNVRIEERWTAPSFTAEEVRASAREVVKLNPDVVVTTGAATSAPVEVVGWLSGPVRQGGEHMP